MVQILTEMEKRSMSQFKPKDSLHKLSVFSWERWHFGPTALFCCKWILKAVSIWSNSWEGIWNKDIPAVSQVIISSCHSQMANRGWSQSVIHCEHQQDLSQDHHHSAASRETGSHSQMLLSSIDLLLFNIFYFLLFTIS